jgi:hypothetical protein
MDGHQHEKLSDEALAREIEDALGVDPSPEFLPRIRARIASERVNESWLWPGLWRWASAVAAVAAVAIIGLYVSNGPSSAPREAHVVSAPPVEHPPAPDRVASSIETPASGIAPVISRVRSIRPAVEARPEVVVSPDETVALRKLVVAIVARRVGAVDVPVLGVEPAPLPPIEEIVPLEELVLEPIKLSPMAGLEGE